MQKRVAAHCARQPEASSPLQIDCSSLNHRPTQRTSRLPGPPRPPRAPPAAGALGSPAAAAARSVQIRTMRLFFESSEQVLHPALVSTFCSTAKLVGLFSLMIVSVPSRWELNASIVFGLKPPPSVPLPIGSVARTFPSSAFKMTQTLGRAHIANRM